MENLDTQLRKLHGSVESLVLHRKDLASLTSSFAKGAAMLSNCEEHTALSRALSQLAETEEKVNYALLMNKWLSNKSSVYNKISSTSLQFFLFV